MDNADEKRNYEVEHKRTCRTDACERVESERAELSSYGCGQRAYQSISQS